MALHRYGDFRVEVFYFDSPCNEGDFDHLRLLWHTKTHNGICIYCSVKGFLII